MKKAVEEMDICMSRTQEGYAKISATHRRYKAELGEIVREIYPGVDTTDILYSPKKTLSSVERNFIQLETDRHFPVYKRYEVLRLEEEAVKKRDGFKRYTVDKYNKSAEEIIADGCMVIPSADSFRFRYKQTIVSQAGRRQAECIPGRGSGFGDL